RTFGETLLPVGLPNVTSQKSYKSSLRLPVRRSRSASAGLSSSCRLFRRQRNQPPSTFALLFFKVATNSIQVVLEFGCVSLANLPDFFNDWIFPHLSPPSILQACKSPAVRNLVNGT